MQRAKAGVTAAIPSSLTLFHFLSPIFGISSNPLGIFRELTCCSQTLKDLANPPYTKVAGQLGVYPTVSGLSTNSPFTYAYFFFHLLPGSLIVRRWKRGGTVKYPPNF